ncbi:hypothetical protein D3C76_1623730 [compost metagenome]
MIGAAGISFNYILSKKEVSRQQAEEKMDLAERVTKSGNTYYVKLGEETIKVTKNELYNGDRS